MKAAENRLQEVEAEAMYPISLTQERWLRTGRISAEKSSYNIVIRMPAIFEQHRESILPFMRQLIERYEILRTRFMPSDTVLLQQEILPAQAIPFAIIEADKSQSYSDVATCLEKFEFIYSQPPLFRIVCCANGSLVFAIHHLISDGTSLVVINKLFARFLQTGQIESPWLQYRDYSLKQRTYAKTSDYALDRIYWKEKLKIVHPRLQAIPGAGTSLNNSGVFKFTLNAGLFELMSAYARKVRCPLFVVVFIMHITAFRRTMALQGDMLVGVTFDDRTAPFENVLGHFAKMLLVKVPDGYDLEAAVKKTYADFIDCIRHSDYQLHTYLRDFNINMEDNVYPVTSLRFNMLNKMPFEMADTPASYTKTSGRTPYEMYTHVKEFADSLEFSITLDCNKITEEKAFGYLKLFTAQIREILTEQPPKTQLTA